MSEGSSRAILRAVGDVALIAGAAQALIEQKSIAWSETASILSGADITFANFEMALPRGDSDRVAPDVSPDLIGVDAALGPFLEAGVDVVALATNHIMDWGAEGLADTLAQFRERGVETVGAGMTLEEAARAVVIERAGLKVGFAAFTPEQRWTAEPGSPGAAPLRFELVKEALEGMGDADVRVISLHWGLEMSSYPTPEDRELARRIAEAGADLILGHHPHVIQGVERFGRTHVVYSMGNFIFDIEAGRVKRDIDPWNLRAGYIVDARLTSGGVETLEAVPVFIGDSGLGAIADGRLRDEIARRIRTTSERIEQGSREVWERTGSRVVLHRLRCLRRSLRDGGFGAVMKEVSYLRFRHFKLLWGFMLSRLRRRSGGQ
ncbi:CapA family protein [bacterium]|nr:CapA family protein [bacterium]